MSWTEYGPENNSVAIEDFKAIVKYGYYVKFKAVFHKKGLYTPYYRPPEDLIGDEDRWFVQRIIEIKSPHSLAFGKFLTEKGVNFLKADDTSKDRELFPCLLGSCDCRGDIRILPRLALSTTWKSESARNFSEEEKGPRVCHYTKFCEDHADLIAVFYLHVKKIRPKSYTPEELSSFLCKITIGSVGEELSGYFEKPS